MKDYRTSSSSLWSPCPPWLTNLCRTPIWNLI